MASGRGSRIGDWLDRRAGWRAARRHLLDEPLPAGTGWWFTLGSVLLAALALQAVTGILLSLTYAPTPDHAHDSVRYIEQSVRAGRLLRGLHYYGASLIVIAAVLHMLRVVVFGSYKAPRELTWLTGLALLQVILAFALTGYLLPWDQRAYWATVVTINIAALAPVAGDAIATLMRGGSEIGALTLTRWYSMHVIVLPAIMAALVAVHLYLMRRHGISGSPPRNSSRRRPRAISRRRWPSSRCSSLSRGAARRRSRRSRIPPTRATCRARSGIFSACSSC